MLEEGVGSFGTEQQVAMSRHVGAGSRAGSSAEHQVLLTAEPHVQPPLQVIVHAIDTTFLLTEVLPNQILVSRKANIHSLIHESKAEQNQNKTP